MFHLFEPCMLARGLPNEPQSDDARYLHRIHQLTHGHLHTLHQLVANQPGILPSPEVRTQDSAAINRRVVTAINDNHVHRASMALRPSPVAIPSQDNIDNIKQNHIFPICDYCRDDPHPCHSPLLKPQDSNVTALFQTYLQIPPPTLPRSSSKM